MKLYIVLKINDNYMKTALIILFTIIMSSFLNAQDRIGEFIINKTNISIIDDIKLNLNKNCELTNDLEFYNNLIRDKYNNSLICEILVKEKCKDLRIFYISKYISYDITMNDIYLFFYKEKLIKLVCNNSKEINILFTKKYGKPYKSELFNPNVISYTMKYDERIIELLWKNGNNKAVSYNKIQYFGKITRDAGSYFSIYDISNQKIISDCDICK
jgi:hypothetical protein